MLPDCKKISELCSENIDEPLTGMNWLKVKFHLMLCAYCRRYGEQIELSSKTVESLEQQAQPNEEVRKTVESGYRELHCQNNNTEQTIKK